MHIKRLLMHAALTESSDVLAEPPRRSERRSKSTAINASSDEAQTPAEASEADLASMDTVASLLASLKTQASTFVNLAGGSTDE